MKDKICGKIKWYKPERGYGYIIGYDEELYFFRNSEKIFYKDEEVMFEAIEREEALIAINVEKIDG